MKTESSKRLIVISKTLQRLKIESINGPVDRAFATEAVDSCSISGRVKPKTTIIGIHSFPDGRLAIKGKV